MLHTIITAAIEAGEAIMRIYNSPESNWEIERKADNSPLTIADRQSHDIITRFLAPTPYPLLSEEGVHMPFSERRNWERLWIVDPLDGTKEFIKHNGEFTVNIALVEQGVPVMGVIYAPAQRRLWWGTQADGAFTAPTDPVTGRIKEPRIIPIEEAQAGRPYRIVASRSHLSGPTEDFIATVRRNHPDAETISAGSSLKICLVAEGRADIYPRLAPTMEWDTAAGHAIALAAGCTISDAATGMPLVYNKEDLHNPHFIVRRGSSTNG